MWYVAQIQARRWALGAAFANLKRQGHDVFVPWCAPDHPVRQRMPISNRPLFPGYVFVSPGFDKVTGERLDWRGMRYTRGVLRLLTKLGSTEPVEAPADLVPGLMARMNADGGLIRLDRFKVGDQVAIVRGPLAAGRHEEPRMGLYQGDDAERVKVLLDILGTPQVVSIPRAHLAVA